ncbi:hypothetical protein BDV35DRAFT_382093 [Aspergillus flavus]|uniref:Uncharacterized protein n=1 Tax=Aspergillus flavus TaxID=5059 RepID=A0A5N6GSY4_ASPFL|nr:hypothetical protein BDV35DRAFT_382093 [Aspergillus flavus]
MTKGKRNMGSEHSKQTLPWSRPYVAMLVLKRLNQSLGFKARPLFDHSKSVAYITTLSRRPAVWSPWSMARFLSKRSCNSNITTGKSAYEEKKGDLDAEGKPTCMYRRLPISVTVWHVLGVCQVTQSIAIQRYLNTSDVIQSKGYKE